MRTNVFDGKNVLITGGTGSLGNALTQSLLKTKVERIRIFSRDEEKQRQMQNEFEDERLRFLLGDVRDRERLTRALEGIHIVIHAAALKQVPAVEYNPFEGVKTNVYGTQNLINACLDTDVELALAISTDKAVNPFNTYGGTKLLMERLFIDANSLKGWRKIKFTCVRYGNVLGSRGSVLPTFIEQIRSGKKITITDPSMTRFHMTMNHALDFIFRSLKNSNGGEVFVPKLKAYRLGELKDAIVELLDQKVETQIISVRPGEKYHESLISTDEIRNTYENQDDYLIFERKTEHYNDPNDQSIKKTSLKSEYSSNNVELLSKDELKNILTKENLLPR